MTATDCMKGWGRFQGSASPGFLSGVPHDPRGIFAVGFYFVWVDNLMSVFKFKFRTAIGSQFWHLLQEVLHQVLVFLGIPEKGYWKELKRALEILGRLKKKKNPPFAENGNNSRKERCSLKPHS